MAIEHQDRHAVTMLQPERGRSACKRIGALLKFIPRITSLPAHNCLACSCHLCGVGQSLQNVHRNSVLDTHPMNGAEGKNAPPKGERQTCGLPLCLTAKSMQSISAQM